MRRVIQLSWVIFMFLGSGLVFANSTPICEPNINCFSPNTCCANGHCQSDCSVNPGVAPSTPPASGCGAIGGSGVWGDECYTCDPSNLNYCAKGKWKCFYCDAVPPPPPSSGCTPDPSCPFGSNTADPGPGLCPCLPCDPGCGCARNTCIGSTCTENDCGDPNYTCDGTKVCLPPPPPPSSGCTLNPGCPFGQDTTQSGPGLCPCCAANFGQACWVVVSGTPNPGTRDCSGNCVLNPVPPPPSSQKGLSIDHEDIVGPGTPATNYVPLASDRGTQNLNASMKSNLKDPKVLRQSGSESHQVKSVSDLSSGQ
jgi:hypothetical protein